MAVPRIRLSVSQRDDLAVACAIGPAKLAAVAGRLQTEQFTIRRSKIESTIKLELGEGPGVALCRFLFGIAGALRRNFATEDEVLEGITRAIELLHKDDHRLEPWHGCREAIRALLTTESLALAAKALDIAYDFERVYVAGRIITSLRPVFDEPRQEIRGATVVQTLRLEFISSDGHQESVSIALDTDDIRRLQESCKQATRKGAKSQAWILDNSGKEAVLPGEEQQ